jgi:hypothetical protein
VLEALHFLPGGIILIKSETTRSHDHYHQYDTNVHLGSVREEGGWRREEEGGGGRGGRERDKGGRNNLDKSETPRSPEYDTNVDLGVVREKGGGGTGRRGEGERRHTFSPAISVSIP